MARARAITGPYETHPAGHVISAKGTEGRFQRTGHGQYVETHANGGYHSFLMGRPKVGPHGLFCALGRESGLERVVWRDGWLWLEAGGLVPREGVPGLIDVEPAPDAPVVRDFADGVLPEEFQWLRTPYPERIFRVEKGALLLTGRESPGSWFEQALVARRQEHHAYVVETTVDCAPETYQAGAGLTTYYNRHKFHAVFVTHEDGVGRCLRVMSCPGDWPAGGSRWARRWRSGRDRWSCVSSCTGRSSGSSGGRAAIGWRWVECSMPRSSRTRGTGGACELYRRLRRGAGL